MSRRALLAVLCPVVAIALVVYAVKRPKPVGIQITPGPADTTVIDGPLDAAGLIDYETALNTRLKGLTTADTNAVVLLLQAIGPQPEGSNLEPDVYKWLGITPPPDEGSYLIRSAAFFGHTFIGDIPPEFRHREDALRYSPWTAEDDPKNFDWVTANEKPLAIAAEAVKRPDYFHPLIARNANGARVSLVGVLPVKRPAFYIPLITRDADVWLAGPLLPLVQRSREIAAILGMRVMLRCGEKKYDAAWQDVMTMHRLARLIGKGATLNELRVGFAIDALAQDSALRLLEAAKPTAKQALALQNELASLSPFPSLADKVDVSERFIFLDVCQFVRRDGAKVLKGLFNSDDLDESPEVLAASIPRLDWNKVLRTGNGWYDRLADALRKPGRADRVAALKSLDAELKGLSREPAAMGLGERLVVLFIPMSEKLSEAADRQEVWFQNELLALAQAARSADQKK